MSKKRYKNRRPTDVQVGDVWHCGLDYLITELVDGFMGQPAVNAKCINDEKHKDLTLNRYDIETILWEGSTWEFVSRADEKPEKEEQVEEKQPERPVIEI